MFAPADEPNSTPGDAAFSVSLYRFFLLFFFCLVFVFLSYFSFWPVFLYSYC